jgi:hypothetical protein
VGLNAVNPVEPSAASHNGDSRYSKEVIFHVTSSLLGLVAATGLTGPKRKFARTVQI